MYASKRGGSSVHNPVNELLVTFRVDSMDQAPREGDGWEKYLTAEFHQPTFDVRYTWGELRHARAVLSRLARMGA